MASYKISITEKVIMGLVLAIIITGFILFYTNLPAFVIYVEEDGFVEWLTVLGLILGVGICLRRLISLRKQRSWWFLFCIAGLALLLFFAAGEEISWGQRILGIKSSEFFNKNNAQHETNLHNLVVNGHKINKIIFSIGLIAMLGLYLIVGPLLYRYSGKFKEMVDKSGIPIARAYQVIAILLLFLLTELLRHEKRAEILEAGITLLFYLIIKYPANRYIFNKGPLVISG